jgi:hypothetical protein
MESIREQEPVVRRRYWLLCGAASVGFPTNPEFWDIIELRNGQLSSTAAATGA